MRARLVQCVAAALVGAARADCDAYIDGECYDKHRLPVARPLDIDRNRNLLYVNDGNRLRVCQLDTQLCNTTSYAWDVLQLAVDQRTGDIYGMIDVAMYKLDLVKNRKELLFDGGVEHIKFKDKLYYTAFGNIMYSIENGKSERVPGSGPYLIYNFVVDKNDDIYFKTYLDTGFGITRLSRGVVDRTERWDIINSLSVDRDGNAVLIDPKSRTVYRATDGNLTEIGTIKDSINKKNHYNEHTLNDVPLFDRDNNIIYRNDSDVFIYLKRGSEIKIETTTSSTPAGNTDDSVDESLNTPESASGTPDESGASPSGAPGQQASHTGDEQQSRCSCSCPKLPNITIKVELN